MPLRQRIYTSVTVLMLVFGCLANISGQQRLESGTPAPDWSDLIGTDDQKHSLAELKDFDLVVICFTCNDCPYAIDYEDRLMALHQRYQEPMSNGLKIAVIAINSNDTPADQLDKMKERAEQKQFQFLYLRDEQHEVAKAYKAIYTPEFFLLDRERKIRYQGALDDRTKVEEVSRQFIIEAIESIGRNEEPTTTYHPARGCKIKFPKPNRDL